MAQASLRLPRSWAEERFAVLPAEQEDQRVRSRRSLGVAGVADEVFQGGAEARCVAVAGEPVADELQRR
jgi:hypothetical protein